jgi:hypothetical protein
MVPKCMIISIKADEMPEDDDRGGLNNRVDLTGLPPPPPYHEGFDDEQTPDPPSPESFIQVADDSGPQVSPLAQETSLPARSTDIDTDAEKPFAYA